MSSNKKEELSQNFNEELFDISTTLKNKPVYRKKFWKEIKKEILGEKYELSLVFIGDALSRKLNKNLRQKDYTANIISVVIADDMGEIFINYPNAKREAWKWNKERKKDFESIDERKNIQKKKNQKKNSKKEGRTLHNFIDFLLIHGMSHLKGYDHEEEKEASEMEKFEVKIRKKFNV